LWFFLGALKQKGEYGYVMARPTWHNNLGNSLRKVVIQVLAPCRVDPCAIILISAGQNKHFLIHFFFVVSSVLKSQNFCLFIFANTEHKIKEKPLEGKPETFSQKA